MSEDFPQDPNPEEQLRSDEPITYVTDSALAETIAHATKGKTETIANDGVIDEYAALAMGHDVNKGPAIDGNYNSQTYRDQIIKIGEFIERNPEKAERLYVSAQKEALEQVQRTLYILDNPGSANTVETRSRQGKSTDEYTRDALVRINYLSSQNHTDLLFGSIVANAAGADRFNRRNFL